MKDFLIEIYSEEIPAKLQKFFLNSAIRLFQNEFNRLSIIPSEDAVRGHISACRFVIECNKMKPKLEKEEKLIKGPTLDQDVSGFLKKHNIASKEELIIKDGYYFFNKINPERNVDSVLSNIMPGILDKIGLLWPRRMRWNPSNKEWIRPIRSIICVLGDQVIDFEYAGVQSSNFTYGNKNITKKQKFNIDNLSDYTAKLKGFNIIIDREERTKKIKNDLLAAELKYGVNFNIDKSTRLIDEVAGLAEFPEMIIGEIPEKFLSIPSSIMENVIIENQKYFVSYDKNDATKLSKFIAIFVESKLENRDLILEGNLKVLNARLTDAEFFFQKDIKLFSSTEDIQVFSKNELAKKPLGGKLGTIYDRVCRICGIFEKICEKNNFGVSKTDVDTLRSYLKLENVTNIYKELPDLQGKIGYHYADKIWSLNKRISLSILNQYNRNFVPSDDEESKFAKFVLMSCLIEYVSSHLLAGSEFSSSKDPFAIISHLEAIVRLEIIGKIENISCGMSVKNIDFILPDEFLPVESQLRSLLNDCLLKKTINLKQKEIAKGYIDSGNYESMKGAYYTSLSSANWIENSPLKDDIFYIYKRCINMAEIKATGHVRLSEQEEGALNEVMYNLFNASKDDEECLNMVKKSRESIDLYLKEFKVSDSTERVNAVKKIATMLESKYDFLPFTYTKF